MAAFSGHLTVILMDTIAVSTATGIPHTVGEKGTLLRGTPSDLGVAVAAAVQALVADCLSTSGVFHFFFTSIGEICGLTWDCVHITDVEIANDKAYLRVDKTLARVSKDAIAALRGADVIKEFKGKNDAISQTKLVLKAPKTQSSIRKIWIPATLAKILRTWQAQQKEIVRVLGNIYHDNNLVLAMDDGRPCEDAVIRKAFGKLQKQADLPRVTFHSLRHLSTGYKLVCSQGDIKSVQGDTGHSRAEMVTDVYAHIVDEDRRNNARRFEADFYANLNLRSDYRHDNRQDDNPANIDLRALLVQLRNDPQLAKDFYNLLIESNND